MTLVRGYSPCLWLVAGSLFWFALPAEAQVSGTVVESGTLRPLAGARVTLQATQIFTETDANGTFSLPAAVGANLVIVGAKKTFFHGSVTVSTPAAGVMTTVLPKS